MYPEGGETFRELSQTAEKFFFTEAAQVKKDKTQPKETPQKILFSDLQKLILDHQLKIHVRFLSNLKRLFREFDTQNFGYITKKQFEGLLDRIDIFDEIDHDSLIATLDKNLWDNITFSDTILLFSHHNIQHSGSLMSLLQYVFENSK